MVLHVLRAIFVLAVLAVAASYAVSLPEVRNPATDPRTGEELGMSALTKVTLIILIPVALATLLIVVDSTISRKNLSGISGLFFGVVAGAVLAYLLGLVLDAVAGLQGSRVLAEYGALLTMIKLLVGAFTIYLCVSFVMQTKDDFRFIIPYVEFAKQTKGPRPLVLDTSVIIDGRIADVADTAILESPLIVPRFVLEEIQAIADSSDKLKRNRGRRGLDMLNRLQSNDKAEVKLLDLHTAEIDQAAEVDHKLVALAQHLDGRIVTNDYNLNKIAQLRGVGVINLNDLANAVKPVFLPGESITVKILKPGEEFNQGVGYLDDGTMVVAEGGRENIGKEMALVVTSVLQTSAGRMVFGRSPDRVNAPRPPRA